MTRKARMDDPMTLGETLKTAREDKGLTPTDIATATHMSLAVIQQIERNDFSRFAAPIYAKGSARLYAEAVGLDPAGLLAEHASDLAPRPPPPRIEKPVRVPPMRLGPSPRRAPPPPAARAAPKPPRFQPRADWRGAVLPRLHVARGRFAGATSRVMAWRPPRLTWLNAIGQVVRSIRFPIRAETLQYVALTVVAVALVGLIVSTVIHLGERRPLLPIQDYKSRNVLTLTEQPPDPYIEPKTARR